MAQTGPLQLHTKDNGPTAALAMAASAWVIQTPSEGNSLYIGTRQKALQRHGNVSMVMASTGL